MVDRHGFSSNSKWSDKACRRARIFTLPQLDVVVRAARARGSDFALHTSTPFSPSVPVASAHPGCPSCRRAAGIIIEEATTTHSFSKGTGREPRPFHLQRTRRELAVCRTTGVKLRGPEGAQRLRATSASTSEFGGCSPSDDVLCVEVSGGCGHTTLRVDAELLVDDRCEPRIGQADRWPVAARASP